MQENPDLFGPPINDQNNVNNNPPQPNNNLHLRGGFRGRGRGVPRGRGMVRGRGRGNQRIQDRADDRGRNQNINDLNDNGNRDDQIDNHDNNNNRHNNDNDNNNQDDDGNNNNNNNNNDNNNHRNLNIRGRGRPRDRRARPRRGRRGFHDNNNDGRFYDEALNDPQDRGVPDDFESSNDNNSNDDSDDNQSHINFGRGDRFNLRDYRSMNYGKTLVREEIKIYSKLLANINIYNNDLDQLMDTEILNVNGKDYSIPMWIANVDDDEERRKITNTYIRLTQRYEFKVILRHPTLKMLYIIKTKSKIDEITKEKKMTREIKAIGYDINITNSRLIFDYTPYVSKKLFNYLTARKYKCKLLETSNLHDDYGGCRKTLENISLKFVQSHFLNLVRIAYGENFFRTQDVGGLYYFEANDEYDKFRIAGYQAMSSLSDRVLHNGRLTPEVECDQDYIITSTDSLYYNPTLISQLMVNNNARDHCKGIVQNFNIYTLQPGDYEEGNIRFTVFYASYRINIQTSSYELLNILPNDRIDITNYINKKLNIPTFIPNVRGYRTQFVTIILPAIRVYVPGNSVPYIHPFPILDKYVMCIENFNKVYTYNESINIDDFGSFHYILDYIMISKNNYYVSVVSSIKNLNNRGHHGFSLLVNAELNNQICMYEKDPEVLPNLYVFPSNKQIIEYKVTIDKSRTWTDIFNNILNGSYKSDDLLAYNNVIFSDDNHLCLINGYINYIEVDAGKIIGETYVVNKKEIKYKLKLSHLNCVVGCYRKMNIDDEQIKNAANIILRTSENEHWEPKLDVLTAHDYAILGAYIANNLNYRIKSNYKLINEVNSQIDQSIYIDNIKSKVEGLARYATYYKNILKHPWASSVADYVDSKINQNNSFTGIGYIIFLFMFLLYWTCCGLQKTFSFLMVLIDFGVINYINPVYVIIFSLEHLFRFIINHMKWIKLYDVYGNAHICRNVLDKLKNNSTIKKVIHSNSSYFNDLISSFIPKRNPVTNFLTRFGNLKYVLSTLIVNYIIWTIQDYFGIGAMFTPKEELSIAQSTMRYYVNRLYIFIHPVFFLAFSYYIVCLLNGLYNYNRPFRFLSFLVLSTFVMWLILRKVYYSKWILTYDITSFVEYINFLINMIVFSWINYVSYDVQQIVLYLICIILISISLSCFSRMVNCRTPSTNVGRILKFVLCNAIFIIIYIYSQERGSQIIRPIYYENDVFTYIINHLSNWINYISLLITILRIFGFKMSGQKYIILISYLAKILYLIRYEVFPSSFIPLILSLMTQNPLLILVSFLPLVGCYNIFYTGSCTFNDVKEMYTFLLELAVYTKYAEKSPKNIKDKVKRYYAKSSLNKYKILNIPPHSDMKCSFDPEKDREPISNIGPQVMGNLVEVYVPIKQHQCKINQCEAVFRQCKCQCSYNEYRAYEFISYSRKWLKRLVREYYKNNKKERITLRSYFTKLGSKSREYKQAWLDYNRNKEIKMEFKMHNKSDEKIENNPEDPKGKARNISAQRSISKLLLGIVCEYGMKVIHNEPWCGPGKNYDEKCLNFQSWINNMNNPGCICCDGSSFDSTQHRLFIKNIDSWFLRMILDHNKEYICELFSYKDVLNVINQSEFTIYTKYFLFNIQGTQLSGRMNTCLSNTIRSACYIQYIIYKSRGKLILYKNIYFEVNGDDQIIFIHHYNKDLYIFLAYKYVYLKEDGPIEHGLGQIAKIFDWYPYITGAEYLSCILLYSSYYNEVLMIRKVTRFFNLSPYTYRNSFKNPIKFDYLKSLLAKEVGYAMSLSCKDIKLFKIYGEKLYELGVENLKKNYVVHKKTMKRIKKVMDATKLHLKYKQYNTRELKANFNNIFAEYLFSKYGITSSEIDELCQQIKTFNSLDDHIHSDFIDKLFPNLTPMKYAQNMNIMFKNQYTSLDNSHSNFVAPSNYNYLYLL